MSKWLFRSNPKPGDIIELKNPNIMGYGIRPYGVYLGLADVHFDTENKLCWVWSISDCPQDDWNWYDCARSVSRWCRVRRPDDVKQKMGFERHFISNIRSHFRVTGNVNDKIREAIGLALGVNCRNLDC